MTDWRTLAACRDLDTDLWFPEDHPTPTDNARATAQQICGRCPVREQCLETALAEEGGLHQDSRYGIRGGLDPKQRRNEYSNRTRRRKKGLPPVAVRPRGTNRTLDEQQRAKLRQQAASGAKVVDLARSWGLNERTVYRIVRAGKQAAA